MEGKAKILAVDDQPANLLAIEGLLEGLDITLITAASGQEALAIMLEHQLALILLDVQMPEMDGYETAALIRGKKQTREIPIVFVTAINKEEEHIFKGYEAGAVDYLFKPLNPHILRSKVKVFLQLYEQKRQLLKNARELEEANQRLHLLSSLDPLTGLANRRRFNEVLRAEWRRAMREQNPVAIILVDIDNFKAYNDYYGHLAGDECLRLISDTLNSPLMRPSDVVARFGGEEFILLLPGTDLAGGLHIAETARQKVEKLAIPHATSAVASCVTVSFGVSAVIPPRSGMDETALIHVADTALYQAKDAGKNRCQALAMTPP